MGAIPPGGHSSFRNRIANVFALCTETEMIDADAGRIVTGVHDDESRRQRPSEMNRHCDPMRHKWTAVTTEGHDAVPAAVLAALP
jgi:hypothetical protein